MDSMLLGTIRMLLVAVGLACAIGLVYRYRDRLQLKLRPTPRAFGMQKVETLHLGYRKFVTVVEIQDRVLVVGIGDKEITLLSQWRKEEKDL
jgi:flagellar biogenesis protein FliO